MLVERPKLKWSKKGASPFAVAGQPYTPNSEAPGVRRVGMEPLLRGMTTDQEVSEKNATSKFLSSPESQWGLPLLLFSA